MKTSSVFIFAAGAGLLLCVSLCTSCLGPRKGTPEGASAFEKLVWADEFDYTGLPDTGKWAYEKGYLRNRELQYYTRARGENARVENGHLVIEARNDSAELGGSIRPVTSASLTTRGRQDWTYGRIEVRAKIPSSRGTWPAIWMLGSNVGEVGWPECGEIDIMEHVGFMPDTIHTNVHTGAYNHVEGTGKGARKYVPSPSGDFHVYAAEWRPDRIDFFVDEEKVFTFRNEGAGTEVWPFDHPQFLILNLAFGGAWGGARGVDLASLPQTYLIDYVRVYQ